jgi:DNA-binding GntR family transcriptional regulator
MSPALGCGKLAKRRIEAAEPQRAVVTALKEDIILGLLKPRERMAEWDLAQRFGVKRHVIRVALLELEALGLVRHERNRGASVRDFPLTEVEHIYDVREALQERAARRIPLPASPDLLRALGRIHADHQAAIARGDMRQVYHLNNQFHTAVFEASGNPYLCAAIERYATLAHAIRSHRIGDPRLLRQAAEEHAAIIDALRAGDRKRLVALCVDHIKPAKDAYLVSRQWERETG